MNTTLFTTETAKQASLKRHSRGPVPEEVKQKISASRAATHAAARAALPPLLVGWKVCTRCSERKHYDFSNLPDTFASDYSPLKRTNADNTVTIRPASRCKRCQANIKNERYAKLTEEERRIRWQKSEDARSVEARREYSRLYDERKRRAAGVQPRNFSDGRNRYRPEHPVSIEPIAAYLRMMTRTTTTAGTGHKRTGTQMGAHQLISITELAELTGVDDKILHRVRSGQGTTIELRLVDRILTHFDAQHLLVLWYPDSAE